MATLWKSKRAADTIRSLSPSLWVDTSIQLPNTNGVCPAIGDMSGVSGGFVQNASARRPTIVANGRNSKPVLRFDGTGQHLKSVSHPGAYTFLHSAASTVFLVWKPWTSSNPNAVGYVLDNITLAGSIGGRHGFYIRPDDRSGNGFTGNAIVVTAAGPTIVGVAGSNGIAPCNQWSINCFQMDPANGTANNRLYVSRNAGTVYQGNISSAAPSSTAPTYPLCIGGVGSQDGTFPYLGDIAAIVAFPSLMSGANVSAVYSALNSIWGIY